MIIKRGKKMRIDELLRQAREMKASDLHVSVGIPPKCRVNGELVALPCGIIMPNDSKALVEQMGRLTFLMQPEIWGDSV